MKGFKKMGELLSDQYSSGSRLGFAKGGSVKQSPQFKQKTSAQNSMDHGVQPAKPDGDSQQQKEAGGTKRLKPGYKKGGKSVKSGLRRKLKKTLGAAATEKEKKALNKGVKKGGKKMPKNVKAKGGSCG